MYGFNSQHDAINELLDSSEDIKRRVNGVVQIGVIEAVEPAKALVKVRHGDNLTPLVPWVTLAAGGVKVYRCPSVGEQCLLLNFGGGENGSTTVALPGVFSEANPSPTTDSEAHTVLYPNGSRITYHYGQDRLSIEQTAGEVYVKSPSKITLDTPLLHCTGDIKADGEITDHTRSMQADREIYNEHMDSHHTPPEPKQ